MIEGYRNVIFNGTIICMIGIIAFGCKDKERQLPEKFRHSESSAQIVAGSKEVLAVVRSITIERLHTLIEDERRIIKEAVPHIGQYRMGGTFGQYFWTWKLGTERTVSISFTGDLKSMDPSEIKVSISEVNR
jgi:hypothetical protein